MVRLIQLLVLVALALLVWRLVRNLLGPRQIPPPAPPGPPAYEPTARCSQCGTHVPRGQLDASGVCERCRA